MTARHLIADRNLSLLRDVNADRLIDPGRQLIAVLSRKHLGVHDNSVFTVRHLEGCVTHLARLLAEDCTEQTLLRGQLRFALGRHLADQNIPCADLCTHADNALLIQVLERVVAYAGHVSGNFLRPQFGISRLRLVLLDVDRGVNIVLDQSLAEQDRVLVVVALPGHEADERILAKAELTAARGRTVRQHLPRRELLAGRDNRPLVIAVALVAA